MSVNSSVTNAENAKAARPRQAISQVSNAPAHPEERQARWLRFVTDNLYHYAPAKLNPAEHSFDVEATSRNTANFTLARVKTAGGAARLARGSREIGFDHESRISLFMPLEGRISFDQLGRSVECGVGQMVLVSASEPLTHVKFGNNDTLCFLLPRSFAETRVTNPEDICLRMFDASDAMASLARDTITSLHRSSGALECSQFRSAASLAGELLLLAFAGRAEAGTTSVRRGNLARAKRIVRQRLHDPDLTMETIAAECGFSVSYLHNLFRDDELRAGQYLLHERLARARSLLEVPRGSEVRVTEVALSCGFSNMSHFSTAFKRAFGQSPREVLQG